MEIASADDQLGEQPLYHLAIDARIQRWVDAMPQYGPGHADLVAQVRAGLPPGLAVAGSYLDGIGVPACIAAAGRAVEALRAEVAR